MTSNSKPLFRNTRPSQAGFTLVEIMVGLTIGLLATIIIMQVLSTFEAQKRTTTATDDAQTNGSIALYNIAREIQQAGYPLIPTGAPGIADSAIECTSLTVNGAPLAPPDDLLAPITIADSIGTSLSDRITIRYGDSVEGGIPSSIAGVTGNILTLGCCSPFRPTSNLGCSVGDTTLIVNGASCYMSTVPASGVSPPPPPPPPYTAQTVTLVNATGAVPGANLSCLGNWNEITYAVNNGNLERNGVPSMSGIANLQAQYGVSAIANSNQITQWVDASGGTWAAPTVADRNRIKAIRIAVVARNVKKEAKNSSNACVTTSSLSAWTGSVSSPAPTINLSASDPDWQCYRYRVFETIIPLRNVIWSKSTL